LGVMKAPHRGTRRCGSAKVEPKIEFEAGQPLALSTTW
jgi:hypothetical protein